MAGRNLGSTRHVRAERVFAPRIGATLDLATIRRLRLTFTVSVSLAYWTLLLWQHLHGGVPGHSFLARDDMPHISNWWGAAVVPVLIYTLGGRVLHRLEHAPGTAAEVTRAGRGAVTAFIAALLYGAAIAVSVAMKRSEMSWLLFRSLPLVALLWPVYRAEYVLGFILALTYMFGAVLPTMIAAVVAMLSVVLHQTVRRGLTWLVARRRSGVNASTAK